MKTSRQHSRTIATRTIARHFVFDGAFSGIHATIPTSSMIPRPVRSRLEELMRRQLQEGGAVPEDFLLPEGEPALAAADSVSWKVFANPVSLTIGGIAAVILELAEPKIRSGVWDHTTFKTDPLRRMRRTGAAAMITVYSAESRATKMIEGVRRMHDRVRGHTPDGTPYHANDPDLLRWVHSTAAFGFLEAYHRYVRPLSADDRDRYFAEGEPVARLYGAENPPSSEAEWNAIVDEMLPRLEPSDILTEFLGIMKHLPIVPKAFRPVNDLLIAAAIGILPDEVRERIRMETWPMMPGGEAILRFAGSRAERLDLAASPVSLARIRLGISSAHSS